MNRTIAVVGAGPVGRGTTQGSGQSGCEVYRNDAIPKAFDDGVAFVVRILDRAVQKGDLCADDGDPVPGLRRCNAVGLPWGV